jgi:hypothetical protein
LAFHAAGVAAATAVIAAGALLAPSAASADPAPTWNGWYKISFQTDRKSGTSLAAKQSEVPYTVWYKFATDCSAGPCVATVVDGPTPKDNAAQATKFDWTGSQWSRTNTWRWDCALGDGTLTFDPASSVTTYSPQADGSLTGTFATNIGSGACQGTVYIPLVAVPADPATKVTSQIGMR